MTQARYPFIKSPSLVTAAIGSLVVQVPLNDIAARRIGGPLFAAEMSHAFRSLSQGKYGTGIVMSIQHRAAMNVRPATPIILAFKGDTLEQQVASLSVANSYTISEDGSRALPVLNDEGIDLFTQNADDMRSLLTAVFAEHNKERGNNVVNSDLPHFIHSFEERIKAGEQGGIVYNQDTIIKNRKDVCFVHYPDAATASQIRHHISSTSTTSPLHDAVFHDLSGVQDEYDEKRSDRHDLAIYSHGIEGIDTTVALADPSIIETLRAHLDRRYPEGDVHRIDTGYTASVAAALLMAQLQSKEAMDPYLFRVVPGALPDTPEKAKVLAGLLNDWAERGSDIARRAALFEFQHQLLQTDPATYKSIIPHLSTKALVEMPHTAKPLAERYMDNVASVLECGKQYGDTYNQWPGLSSFAVVRGLCAKATTLSLTHDAEKADRVFTATLSMAEAYQNDTPDAPTIAPHALTQPQALAPV